MKDNTKNRIIERSKRKIIIMSMNNKLNKYQRSQWIAKIEHLFSFIKII